MVLHAPSVSEPVRQAQGKLWSLPALIKASLRYQIGLFLLPWSRLAGTSRSGGAMQSEFVLKALSYGVLGLSAVMLLAAWRVLLQEQQRQLPPRKRVLRFTFAFMVFCVALACLNAYVQVRQFASDQRLRSVRYELQEINDQLCSKGYLEVKQAAESLKPDDEVKAREVKAHLENLKYLIAGIQTTVKRAWQETESDGQLQPCREPF